MSTLIQSPFSQRTQKVITHSNTTVEENSFGPSDLLYLVNNQDSQVTLTGQRCMKIIIDGSKNSKITTNVNSITTGFVEIIKCENSTIVLNSNCSNKVKTLQLDTLNNCEIVLIVTDELVTANDLFNSFCAQLAIVSNIDCSNVKFRLETGNGKIISESNLVLQTVDQSVLEHNRSSIQFISKFVNSTNGVILKTEIAVREGCGYVATKSEKAFKDRIQQEFERRMERFINEKVLSGEDPQELLLKKEKAMKKSKEIQEKLKSQRETQSSSSSGGFLEQIKKFKNTSLNQAETKESSLLDFVGDNDQIDFGNRILPKNNDHADVINSITGVPEDIREFVEDEESLLQKATELAQLLKNCKHCTVYTGAGVSTSAKIPDYRGPKGVWTLKSSGKENEIAKIDIEQALPTFSHYAIRHLMKLGYVKYVVSTNVDGLHRRSGLTTDQLSELHGNCYREVCGMCGKEYLRGFDVLKTVTRHTTHITGRLCECGGKLRDTIIHFSESLPEKELENAIDHSKKSDLALVMGTSLMVNPAAQLPKMGLKNKGSVLCIVNLQKTPLDVLSSLRVFSKTDEFMRLVMQELGELDNIDTEFDALAEW